MRFQPSGNAEPRLCGTIVSMPRASAILLLALFGFALIGPALLADGASSVPACCRKNGTHHCAMNTQDQSDDPDGALQSVRNRCPMFPSSTAAPGHNSAATVRPSSLFFAAIVSHPTAHAQTNAHYRVSFSRSWHKRGPPSLS